MKSTHTPGPWIAADTFLNNQPNRIFIRQKKYGGENIADLGPSKEANQANARLIAAAPELLEALADCITDANATCNRGEKYQRMRTEYINQVARAAIAKAIGGDIE